MKPITLDEYLSGKRITKIQVAAGVSGFGDVLRAGEDDHTAESLAAHHNVCDLIEWGVTGTVGDDGGWSPDDLDELEMLDDDGDAMVWDFVIWAK